MSFKTSCCFLVFNLDFTSFRGIAERLPACLFVNRAALLKVRQKFSATLWQICQKMSKDSDNLFGKLVIKCQGYWQPSDKFLRLLQKKAHIYQRIANPSNPLPEGTGYPLEESAEGY